MAGIVDDHVETARVRDDLGDAGVGRGVRLHVEFDGAQIGRVFHRPGGDVRDLRRIAAGGLPHRGVDRVAGLGQSLGGHETEARRGAGDEDDGLGHDEAPCLTWVEAPFGSDGTGPDQMTPPLARRVWPLIQAPSGPAKNATASAMSWG
jgi:hypothetical protein